MKIKVKNLLNQPESSIENYPIELVKIPLDEGAAKVTGEVLLTNLGDFILAKIIGEAQLDQPCHRCLKDTKLHLPLNFSREFRAQILNRVQDDGEAYPIVDGEIDLAPLLAEEIIASIPVRVLCREDCQGLCQKCGANLNDNPCKCDKVKDEISNKIKF